MPEMPATRPSACAAPNRIRFVHSCIARQGRPPTVRRSDWPLRPRGTATGTWVVSMCCRACPNSWNTVSTCRRRGGKIIPLEENPGPRGDPGFSFCVAPAFPATERRALHKDQASDSYAPRGRSSATACLPPAGTDNTQPTHTKRRIRKREHIASL